MAGAFIKLLERYKFWSVEESMRLLSYVVKIDAGFAPNPFWGYCTLAACTPNHQGIRAEVGDWILGNSTADTGNLLLYAMRIAEWLDFDDYFRDERFATKKAAGGSWQERCGDNIYFRNDANRWVQALAFAHTNTKDKRKDLRYHRVFISNHFYYFGENAPAIPSKYASLIQRRQGCTWHEGELVKAFINWLEGKYQPPGIYGQPWDREEAAETQCVRVGSNAEVC